MFKRCVCLRIRLCVLMLCVSLISFRFVCVVRLCIVQKAFTFMHKLKTKPRKRKQRKHITRTEKEKETKRLGKGKGDVYVVKKECVFALHCVACVCCWLPISLSPFRAKERINKERTNKHTQIQTQCRSDIDKRHIWVIKN